MVRRRKIPAACLVLALAAALAGCSRSKPPAPPAEQDPAVAAALNEQLMTDPDLARSNAGNRVLVGGGPATAPIPLEDRSPEAVARARADAARLLGPGGALAQPPPGRKLAPVRRDTPAATALAVLVPAGRACADRLEPGFIWAARVPAAMPIYPRGHAQQAAGTDRDGCGLRVVNYVTPAPPGEVAAFYWTVARRAGLAPEHVMAGGDHAVLGRKGAGQAAAYVRVREDGLTEVDLVVSRM